MTTSVRRSPSVQPATPAQPRSLAVKVSENDPALKAETSRDGRLVTLRGTANNRGTVASFLTLEFDGRKVTVRPQRGETARDLREKLGRAMPPGYQVSVPVYVGRTGNELASFEVHKVPVPKSNVAQIDAAFAKATRAKSEAGAKVSVDELRAAVTAAEQGGLSEQDRAALARNWSALFTGTDVRATPAAQREYAKLQQQLDLPVFPTR